jgi:hypothetical protein
MVASRSRHVRVAMALPTASTRQREVLFLEDNNRRRFGVLVSSLTVGILAWELNLPGWEIGLLAAGIYVGLTMALGLDWKWW